jgi:PKD domain-containing protein
MRATTSLSILGAALVLAAACTREKDPLTIESIGGPPRAVIGCGYTGPNSEREEEIFGHVIGNQGVTWDAGLQSRDDPSTGNQPTYAVGNVPVNFALSCDDGGHANAGAEWGWYGQYPAGDQCVSLTTAANNQPERHRSYGSTFPDENEMHCVNAGRFVLTLTKNDVTTALVRPIDHLAFPFFVANAGRVEDPTVPPGIATNDVLVDYDENTTGSSVDPVIEVSVTPTVQDASWAPAVLQGGAFRAPSNFWVRLSAGSSIPHGSSIVQVLVRYFWNHGVDTTRTGFINARQSNYALVRAKQLPTGARTIRAHLVQPFEGLGQVNDTATSYGAFVDLPFNVSGPLTAVPTTPTASVIVGTAVQFNETGQNGGGGNQYQWQFGTGEGTYPFPSSAGVTYTFASTGSKTVTVTKKDQYGFTVSGTTPVNVLPHPSVTIAAMYSPQSASVKPNQSCSYRADATGGNGSYTYAWYKDGTPLGSTRVVDVSVGHLSFSLTVVAYSLGDSGVSPVKTVTVSSSGILCP